MSSPLRITHIITGLRTGGAETMLCRTVENADSSAFRHDVICLTGGDDLVERLASSGAGSVVCLGMRGPFSGTAGFFRMISLLRQNRPALVQCWLTHAMLLGSLAARCAGNPPVIWAVHTGFQTGKKSKPSIRHLNAILAKLSGVLPQCIVSCSQAVLEHSCKTGYQRQKMVLIHNGTDTEKFRPDPLNGRDLRERLGIPHGAPVVGIVGRLTPEKDFPTFFRTALQVQKRLPHTHFILCGSGLDDTYEEGRGWLSRSPRPANFHLLGARQDIHRVYNAFSITVLTSVSEAFPLILGESMACGVPCVATDVGDCRAIVGDTGRIVPPVDPMRLAEVWCEMLTLPETERIALGIRARERITQFYSMDRCIQRYEALYREVLSREPGRFSWVRLWESLKESAFVRSLRPSG